MKRLRSHDRGDTIVEVLISVAIVSLILTVSYQTTNRNTRTIQDAQERAQALQLAQRQLEFLKADNAAAITTADNYCYGTNGAGHLADHLHPATDPCTLLSDGTTVGDSTAQPAYAVSVSGTMTSKFTVNITWNSIVDSGKDNLTMYYRP